MPGEAGDSDKGEVMKKAPRCPDCTGDLVPMKRGKGFALYCPHCGYSVEIDDETLSLS